MVLMAEGTGPLAEQAAGTGAESLFERHQILRCRLTGEDPIPQFVDDVRFDDLPLTMQHAHASLVEIWERLLHEPLLGLCR